MTVRHMTFVINTTVVLIGAEVVQAAVDQLQDPDAVFWLGREADRHLAQML